MTERRLTLGRQGEEAAAAYLLGKGLRIVGRNHRTPVGEIDLIARQGRELVFVEVKTRSSSVFGSPAEAVGPRKQRQIVRAAQWYLGTLREKGMQPRFDVVAVIVSGEGVAIEHIPAAFGV